jgi:hypothetical protein
MQTVKLKMFNDERGFVIVPDQGGADDVVFQIARGVAVNIEVDPKTGKTKAISVDLAEA